MKTLEIYGQRGCDYCIDAIAFAQGNSLPVVYRDIVDLHTRNEMFRRNPAAKTVPQIFIGDVLIGGFVELSQTPLNQLQQMIGE